VKTAGNAYLDEVAKIVVVWALLRALLGRLGHVRALAVQLDLDGLLGWVLAGRELALVPGVLADGVRPVLLEQVRAVLLGADHCGAADPALGLVQRRPVVVRKALQLRIEIQHRRERL